MLYNICKYKIFYITLYRNLKSAMVCAVADILFSSESNLRRAPVWRGLGDFITY